MKSRMLTCCVLVGAVVILAAGCGKKESAAVSHANAQAVAAAVAEVRSQPVDVLYEAVGTVRSKTTSVLSSKVVGNVEAVYVQPGEQAEAGKLLVKISSGDVSAQLDRARADAAGADSAIKAAQAAKDVAEANHALAKATFDRFKTLLERKSVSQQEFDEAQARFKTAVAEAARADEMLQSARARKKQSLAEVASAEAKWHDTQLVAPLAGLVTKKNVDVGDQAAPGIALLTIEDNQNYRLEVAAGEDMAGQIHVGDAALVTIDALGAPVQAKVAEIVPAIAPASRSFLVKLNLPQQKDLRSGMYGKAAFTVGKRPALLLPATAVIERGELVCVYSVDGGNVAHLRLVKTGKRFEDNVEVLSGLSAGERVVIGNTNQVQDGSPIQQ